MKRLILLTVIPLLGACTVTVPPTTTPPASPPPSPARPAPTVVAGTPQGFVYTVTDPAGKQVSVQYYGGTRQRRLSVAVKPDGTALLTSSQASQEQSMADLADALRVMAGPESIQESSMTREDYFAPPPPPEMPPCKQCRANPDCEECYEYIKDADEHDPVRDGK